MFQNFTIYREKTLVKPMFNHLDNTFDIFKGLECFNTFSLLLNILTSLA